MDEKNLRDPQMILQKCDTLLDNEKFQDMVREELDQMFGTKSEESSSIIES